MLSFIILILIFGLVLEKVHGWFYTPGKSVRTLADMQTVYHSTVGRNCVIELDFAIDREGLVDPVHAARYAEFGAWIHNCYGYVRPSLAHVHTTYRTHHT